MMSLGIGRGVAKSLVLLAALTCAAGVARGQGSRKDDVVFNARGVPMAGATVRVCSMPATGQPCTPVALIYSDPGLTQAMANPTTTDGMGNYTFYAAPGRYMIEVSGPGISTKQFANVILPSDPSAPTFTNLSTTGGINAFSLTLTGSLTVNGSTSVVGNLSSGTVTLNNQTAAPGAASAGTVNIYTKQADKRLHYKDETGTEIGPLASGTGAQTNIANTFTAPQSFDSDFHAKGPNPFYDISRFGGYAGPNYATGTMGNATNGSATLGLTSALDFANNQGVLVLGAGPLPTIATPTGLTVAPVNATGTTSYYYCVVDEDYADGKTACSASANTATGPASLGIQSVAIANRARASGVATITTSVAHNFVNGAQVNVSGTGDGTFEGAFTITSVPSGTTFTYNQIGAADVASTATSGSAQVGAKMQLKWNASVGYTVLKHLIYRCTSSCTSVGPNYTLAGVAIGIDGSFVDGGYPVSAANIDNGDAPATAPTAALNQWLSTTIVAGGGTTSVTLANAAGNTVSGAKVLHDNTPVLLKACTSFTSATGGTIYVPSVPGAAFFPIASTLNMSACPNQTEIDFAVPVWSNAAILPNGSSKIKGLAAANTSQVPAFYNLQQLALFQGYAFPFFYMRPGLSSNFSMEGLLLTCAQAYQTCIYQDEATDGSGVTSIRYTDVFPSSGNYSTAYVAKGGFGYFWERGGWSNNALNFNSPPAVLFTTNCGYGQGGQQLPAIVYTEKTYVFGGMVWDSCGQVPSGSAGANHMEFRELLAENAYGPMFRANTGLFTLFAIDFLNTTYADLLGGASSPMFDLTGAQTAGVRFLHPFCATGTQPLLETANNAGYNGIEVNNTSQGCGLIGANTYVMRTGTSNADIYSNMAIAFSGANGRAFYQMSVPAQPQSLVLAAGGAVGVGAHTYALTASDFDGGETTLTPPMSIATTSGNQTVNVTLPASFPAGAAGVNVYRDGALANANSCFKPQFTTPGTVFTDTASFTCGNTAGNINTAGATTFSGNGVAAGKVRINGEALTAAPRGEQNVFLPGALTAAWTGSSWTLDKGITLTRVQAQAKTAPAGCTTNAVVRVTDGTTPVNVTVVAAANDSGTIAQNYAAGATITVSVATAAAGCTTSPADANITLQYRMQ